MILIEFDLAGAEWVVVAYLSGDPNMLGVIDSGKSPHVITGSLISGAPEEFVAEEHKAVGGNTNPDTILSIRSTLEVPKGISFLPRSMSVRQMGKKANHGLNYYMRYRRAALEWEIPETDAEPIVELYSKQAYPTLQEYWSSIRQEMKDNKRCLSNCFGRKVCMMGEWGVDLFMAAYSFKPQSTVFDICRKGMVGAYNDPSAEFISMKLGAQVHDSLMINYPMPTDEDGWYNLCRFLDRMTNIHMHVPIAYADVRGEVRDFVLGADCKMGISWGEMKSLKVTQDYDAMIEAMRQNLRPDQEAVASDEPEWSQAVGLPDLAPTSSPLVLGTEEGLS